MLAIYLCFGIATLHLKRLPILGQDAAGEIGGTAMRTFWSLLDFANTWTFPAFVIAIILQLLLPGVKFRISLKRVALSIVIPVIVILFLVFAPTCAFWWMLDSYRQSLRT